MSDQATDEDVAAAKELLLNPFSSLYENSLVAKLLARLERVEEELDAMKLGYRGFP